MTNPQMRKPIRWNHVVKLVTVVKAVGSGQVAQVLHVLVLTHEPTGEVVLHDVLQVPGQVEGQNLGDILSESELISQNNYLT